MARVGAGIRSRHCIVKDVCADCGSIDPGWASINRGILICDECCSVHRSLGRHISHVKSLNKGSWHPSELAMVHSLNISGANHIWEHTLLDPSNFKAMRRKPHAKDPVHPSKADFIRAKHQMMSFVYRPCKEDITSIDMDVSSQLHASVRTHNLEISLRLLSQGADPNYFHKEKGNCPLHVAARAGQDSQVELLVIYGADPGTVDKDGRTPVDYARDGGFHDIATRLIELQYELPDRLAFYLCGRKADHENGQHWIIPEIADTVESIDIAKEAKSKLISLPNHSFEELACDVYDEVDRRETDGIWLSTLNQSVLSDRCSVPFLPVNPEFSATRNQGRQKLARFNAREFATLIIDILIEIQRKIYSHLPSTCALDQENNQSDSTLTLQINIPHQCIQPTHNFELGKINDDSCDKINNLYRQTCPSNSAQYSFNTLVTSTVNTAQSYPSLTSITHTAHNATRPKEGFYDDEPLYDSVASEDDYSSWDRKQKIKIQQGALKKQTNVQDAGNQEVHESPGRKPGKVVNYVATAVSIEEYLDMKRYLELSETKIKELQDNNIVMTAKLNELSTVVNGLKEENDNLRAQSQRSSPHFFPNQSTPPNRNYASHYDSPSPSLNLQNGDCAHQSPRLIESGTTASAGATSISRQVRPCSMFESRGRNITPYNSFSGTDSFHQHYGSYESQSLKSIESSTENLFHVTELPSQEEVVRKTEIITKRIQELLLSAQDSQQEKFTPCSEHISKAVKEMAELFPKMCCSPDLWNAVQQLLQSSARLQFECRNHVNSQLHILDPGRVTQHVIQCAYDIAKAAKVLVTHFQ